jgi:tRNA nucleotidyltransferase/poly(A) polymerase
VIRRIPLKTVAERIKPLVPNGNMTLKNSAGELLIRLNGESIRIILPKKNGKFDPNISIEDDAKSRIFTTEAMYISLKGKKTSKIIDYFGGQQDIKEKKIATIGKADQVLKDDPLQIVKAISLMADLGFRPNSNLFHAIRINSRLVASLPSDEIKEMLESVLLSKRPSKYLKLLYDTGLMVELLPELALCKGVKQNEKYHKFDVFTHCVTACDSTKPDLVMRLAALLHDAGKVIARNEVMKRGQETITFYNHEAIGAELVKKNLRKLGFDEKKVVRPVSDLVRYHMYNYMTQWTDKAVRRFIRKMKITDEDLKHADAIPLFQLRRADRMASGQDLKEVSPIQRILEERMRGELHKMKSTAPMELVIDGIVVMEKFSLKEGPTVGHILNHLRKAVASGQIQNTKEALIEEASKHLSEALV